MAPTICGGVVTYGVLMGICSGAGLWASATQMRSPARIGNGIKRIQRQRKHLPFQRVGSYISDGREPAAMLDHRYTDDRAKMPKRKLDPLPWAAFQILLSLAEEDLHGYGIMRQVAS